MHKRKKDLLWLMVSEVSIHGQLVPLLWSCGESDIMAARECGKEGCSLMAARNQKE
jgi:hypothetical protein